MNQEKKYFLREVIGNYLAELGEKNERIMAVTADLMASSRIRPFVEKYPKRSFNVGIAEQNMVSFAAGLAHEGYIPFVFSMAPFVSLRACEQCRTDVAYGRLNVRLVGTYTGVSGGVCGATHWGTEDVAVMSCMEGMTVLEPSDPVQAKRMLDAALDFQGSIYMRVTYEPVYQIYEENCPYEIGKAAVPVQGNDGAFICSGITVKYAIQAAEKIKELYSKEIRVVDMHTIKPIDAEAVLSAAKTGRIVAAQDHTVIGGLGQLVAAVLAENGCAIRFKILGTPDQFIPMGHISAIYHKYCLDADGLFQSMCALF